MLLHGKEVDLEANAENPKYTLLTLHRMHGKIITKKIENRSFENLSQFKYLGMTVANQNLIQEEIQRRQNSGNACYRSVQNPLSFRLLSKNVEIRMYKTSTYFCLWFCIGVKPGPWHYEKNIH
jgi:hypothetical protein